MHAMMQATLVIHRRNPSGTRTVEARDAALFRFSEAEICQFCQQGLFVL